MCIAAREALVGEKPVPQVSLNDPSALAQDGAALLQVRAPCGRSWFIANGGVTRIHA